MFRSSSFLAKAAFFGAGASSGSNDKNSSYSSSSSFSSPVSSILPPSARQQQAAIKRGKQQSHRDRALTDKLDERSRRLEEDQQQQNHLNVKKNNSNASSSSSSSSSFLEEQQKLNQRISSALSKMEETDRKIANTSSHLIQHLSYNETVVASVADILESYIVAAANSSNSPSSVNHNNNSNSHTTTTKLDTFALKKSLQVMQFDFENRRTHSPAEAGFSHSKSLYYQRKKRREEQQHQEDRSSLKFNHLCSMLLNHQNNHQCDFSSYYYHLFIQCICCIICDASERFPFVMCSVRDEMYTRPTSDVKVHPISGTTCCLDESLPEDQRGTWLAINHKLGTFSLLTNSTQQGRPEPAKGAAPSRGLLVLSAVETKTGRLNEENLAVPVSWTNGTSSTSDETNDATNTQTEKAPRKNIFNSAEQIGALSGFNLLSGSLTPGNIDVRYSSNVYGKQFDECLNNNNKTKPNSWSVSNSFLDNKHEPRLNWLTEHVRETMKKFLANDDERSTNRNKEDEKTSDNNKRVTDLANELGKCLVAQPNFSNEDLPVEHLNLSEKKKECEIEVDLERAAQRNISTYVEWQDDENPSLTEEERKNTFFNWGTRSHIIVISEKIDSKDDPRLLMMKPSDNEKKKVDCLVHFFIRPTTITVDKTGPRHGPSRQPNFELVPGEWKHLMLPHFVD